MMAAPPRSARVALQSGTALQSGFIIIDWRPVVKGALLGFAEVQQPSGQIINDVTIVTAENGPLASPPGKPMIGPDGMVLTDHRGKVRYSPVIQFASKEVRSRWSDAVIAAVRTAHPEAFTPGDAP